MTPNLLFALNQQYQQGCYIAQQAVMAEQMGNGVNASQFYDQAIGVIANTVGTANQYGVPITDNVFFGLAFCHFNAARLKAAMGWPQAVPQHLNIALQAINQALAMNPNFFAYHSAAGLILLAMSNVPAAVQEFQRAVQLNPADAWSQWMLSSLYTSQGNTMAANQHYAAAASAQPSLPQPQQFVPLYQGAPSHSGGQQQGGKHDWFGLIDNALKLGNSLMGMMQQGGQSQQGWGQMDSYWPGY